MSTLRELIEAATPVPWFAVGHDVRTDPHEGSYRLAACEDWSDAEFIRAARTALPALVEALERSLPYLPCDDTPPGSGKNCPRCRVRYLLEKDW